MWSGLRVFGRALRHWNQRAYVYIWANLLWAGLAILVITAPAAWAGLIRMSYVAHRQPSTSFDEFWTGFRENLRRTLPIALVNMVILTVTISNLLSYASETGIGILLLRGVWIGSALAWFAVQFFAWPFFYAMKQPTFLGGLRNASAMLVTNPFFCIAVLSCALLTVVLSTVLAGAWLLLTGSVLAVLANSAVQDRLRHAGIEPEPTFDEGIVVNPDLTDV